MDLLLIDIKNFLKKLESGQHEIEAGQWELHRDISNIKKIIEELKNLKGDVEKMRLSSVQQIGMMKGLQEKIDMIKQGCDEEPLTVSERSLEIEKVSKRPNENQPKGYKKRKCHVVRSEEIIEITSQMSEEKSNEEESESKCEQTEGTNDSNYGARHYRQICMDGLKKNERYAKDQDILQRYLQDSAMYSDRKGSAETSGWSHERDSEGSYTPFWDEYGSRRAQDSSVENQEENDPEEAKPVQSILPTRASSSSSSTQRHVAYRVNYDRRKHGKSGGVHFCVTCGKGFHSRGKMKDHETVHEVEARNSKSYRCSYCHKPCATPEKLTSHLRRCRIIMRSHYKRRN